LETIEKVEAKKRVLIVDDEPQIGKIFGLNLKLAGYDVVSVTRGSEAIELVRSQKFDLMLLDVLMPGISGINVLENIRTFSPIRVIMCSAVPDVANISRQYGANGYISKPVYPALLLEMIRAVLGQDNASNYRSMN
jgi:DNA-binding response OmpR family regulator